MTLGVVINNFEWLDDLIQLTCNCLIEKQII